MDETKSACTILYRNQPTSFLIQTSKHTRTNSKVGYRSKTPLPHNVMDPRNASSGLAVEDEWLEKLDFEQFRQDVEQLGAELKANQGEADERHLHKILLWNRLLTLMGLLTLGMYPNVFTVMCLSLATFSRWTMVGHHVCHGGYERVDTSGRYSRFRFAMGSLYRRFMDWLDWMLPEAWNIEHNKAHHYSLNEEDDPDLVESNLEGLREIGLPLVIKYLVVGFFMVSWKWFYYAPNTFNQLALDESRKLGNEHEITERNFITIVSLANPPAWLSRSKLVFQVLAPYFLYQFIIIPLPLLVLFDEETYWNGMTNLALAEVLTNMHSFLAIVTNHAGDDLYKFENPCQARSAHFYLRQIIGSANFRTGGDVNDFLHGFLNYQIEHHLWPNLSMLSYQKAQPRVKQLCAKHGIPYVQQSVFWRLKKTVDVMVGTADMRKFPAQWEPEVGS